MDDRDDLRSALRRAAADLDVGDAASARTAVDVAVRRRRRRTRATTAVGAVVVVATAGAIVLATRDDDAGTLRTSDPTVVDVSDDTEPPPETSAPIPSPLPEVATAEVVGGAWSPVPGGPDFAEWVVPWRDGFLAGSTVFPPQPLPAELPEEIAALFPQEVRDLFGGELPPTIAEATEMLSEAGLLDEVSAVISEYPEASAAIYGEPVTEPVTVDASFTTDGSTWEPVEMTLPPGATSTYGAVAVGDRVAVAYGDDPYVSFGPGSPSPADPPAEPRSTVTVATTTDLLTWTTQEIVLPSPPVALPPGVVRSVMPQMLVANDDGWVLTVSEFVDIDVFSLLPEDVRAEVETAANAGGYGYSSDDRGVRIEYDFERDEAGSVLELTWDELGIDPSVVPYLQVDEFSTQTWSAPWTGDPVRSDAPVAIGPMLATDAGFLGWNDQLWFSNDGVSWAPNPLPDDAGPVTGAFAVDGGAIIISMADDGTAIVYRVDAMGGSAERLEIAGLPRNVQPWMSGDAAIVFDASEPPMQTTETLVVEVDGYRLEVPPMTGEFRLVDAATGAVVVADDIRDPEAAESSPFQFGPDGITVSDPETGEVVVTIPNDVYEAALQDLYGDPAESEYAPEIWLLASRDGERFVVEPVGGEIHSTVASNAGRVLFRIDGDGWASITLP